MATYFDRSSGIGKVIVMDQMEALQLIVDLTRSLQFLQNHSAAPAFSMTATEQEANRNYPSILSFEVTRE